MRIKLNTTSTTAALSYIMPACKPKSPQPVYSNVLIEPVSETQARLTASNGEIQLTATIDADWNEQGSTTVEGKKFNDIIKSLPKDSTATMSLKDGNLTVTCGRSRFKLKTISAVDFPVFNTTESAQQFTVDAALMRKALDRVSPSMAQNDVRYYLNGVHMSFSASGAEIVATDGHRMNVVTLPGSWPETAVTLPADSVRPVAALMVSGDVDMMISATSLEASSKGRTISVKLVDGKYPDYRRVIPKANDKYIEFTRNELLSAVQRVKLLSNEKYKGIKLDINGGECVITGQNTSHEEAQETVPVVYSGADIVCGFNADYVTDALGVVESDQVVFCVGEGQSGVLIKDGDLTAVVMQMRI